MHKRSSCLLFTKLCYGSRAIWNTLSLQQLIQRLADERHLGLRERTLTPVVTTYLFLQQFLDGNRPCGRLRHLSGLDFTDTAYCQARAGEGKGDAVLFAKQKVRRPLFL